LGGWAATQYLELAEGALKFQGFGGEGAGGGDGAGVFVPQRVQAGGGQRVFLAADALHFGYPGVRIEVGCGEELVAGFFNRVFHAQPVEQRALGLLLAGGDFDQAADEMGSNPLLFPCRKVELDNYRMFAIE